MAYLLAQDTVNGAEGKGFVTRGGRVYEVAGFKNVRTGADIQSTDMRVVGTRKIQNKNNGVKLRGKASVFVVTHDPDHALFCADRVVVMEKGIKPMIMIRRYCRP